MLLLSLSAAFGRSLAVLCVSLGTSSCNHHSGPTFPDGFRTSSVFLDCQMNNDTIDWLDLDLWPEKEAQKAADMDNSYAWLAQPSQALSGQPLHNPQYQLQPQVMQPPDGMLFQDAFNHQHSTAGSLLSELSGVRKNCCHTRCFIQMHIDDQDFTVLCGSRTFWTRQLIFRTCNTKLALTTAITNKAPCSCVQTLHKMAQCSPCLTCCKALHSARAHQWHSKQVPRLRHGLLILTHMLAIVLYCHFILLPLHASCDSFLFPNAHTIDIMGPCAVM